LKLPFSTAPEDRILTSRLFWIVCKVWFILMIDKLRKNMSSMLSIKKTPEQKSVLGRSITRKIINRSLRDLASADLKTAEEATKYFYSSCFTDDVIEAGYPSKIIDATRESLELSNVQRKFIVKRILEWLRTPSEEGVSTRQKKQK